MAAEVSKTNKKTHKNSGHALNDQEQMQIEDLLEHNMEKLTSAEAW